MAPTRAAEVNIETESLSTSVTLDTCGAFLCTGDAMKKIWWLVVLSVGIVLTPVCWRSYCNAKIVQAAYAHDDGGVKKWLRLGRYPNIRSSGASEMVVSVATKGKDETLSLLLSHGADPNVEADSGWTPLIAAVEANRPSTVKLLLDSGADPNKAGASGRSPLSIAILNHEPDIVALLKSHGAVGKSK